MATIRVYNYEFGNYNETLVPNTQDLNRLFERPLMSFDNINVSYNDGLMLTLTLNITDDLIEQINYLTVNTGPKTDEEGNVISYDSIRPYFVLGYQYIMKDQYSVSCKLDTVLYKLEDIKQAEGLIERGFIDEDNNLIYNNEGIEVTSIKTGEYPIVERMTKNIFYIRPEIGWYAVYMDSKIGTTKNDADKLLFKTSGSKHNIYATYNKLSDFPLYEYLNNPVSYGNVTQMNAYLRTYGSMKYAAGSGGGDDGFAMIEIPPTGVRSFAQLVSYKVALGGVYDEYDTNFHIDDSNFINTNPQFGEVTTSKLGGLRYEVDGVEIPPTAFYDYHEAYIWDAICPFSVWGGKDLNGGLGVFRAFSNFRWDEKIDSYFRSKQAELDSILATAQLSNTAITGTKYTGAELMEWDGRLFKVGEVIYRVSVTQSGSASGKARANTPENMIKAIVDNKTMAQQTWNPKGDALSVELLEQKELWNYNNWNEYSWYYNNWITPLMKAKIHDKTKDYNYETIHYDIVTETYTVRITRANTNIEPRTLQTFGGPTTEGVAYLNDTIENQPYKILLFPFGDIMLDNKGTYNEFDLKLQDESTVLDIINNLIIDYGGGNSPRIYDVQRLPYGSIDLNKYLTAVNVVKHFIYFKGDGTDEIIKNHEYYFVKDNVEPAVVFFIPIESRRTFIGEVGNLFPKDNIKLDSITRKAVLLSNTYKTVYTYEYPKNDYSNQFEITVDLKPITPYFNIDIIGSDKGLTPNNFTDGRGLNIAEDFSSTQVTDSFNAYKRENYNYLNSFNSQQDYENQKLAQEQTNAKAQMNLQQKQAWENYGVNAASGIVGGAAKAAVGGAVMGGPMGAAVGAVGGAVKGVLDAGFNAIGTAVQNQQQKEMLSLQQAQGRDMLGLQQAQAKQQFNYSVENIKLLPPKLDKVSGITGLAKTTARIALYDTTEEERKRVKDYFDYNAYTLNTYDTFKDYIDYDRDITYVKGNVIKFNKPINNIILQDINTRLSVGVRFNNRIEFSEDEPEEPEPEEPEED